MQVDQSNKNAKPVVVIGDGWAALGTVGLLVQSGVEVKWIVGSGARTLFPLASMEWGPGVATLQELAFKLGFDFGEVQTGTWIREFRNKAFREPFWAKAPTPAARLDVKNESLWAPECQMVGIFEARWDQIIPSELDEEIRKKLLSGQYTNLERIEEVPVNGFTVEKDEVRGIKLGSGEEINCSQVVYADRWGLIPGLEGLPKALSFLRKREPLGILQASFVHDFGTSLGVPAQSFFSPLFRAASNEVERHVWGHFSSDGRRSIWTLGLAADEIENNHEIGKKLRRLKGTLDRMFQGSDLIPEGKADFAATIVNEQVRFEEEAFFSEGAPLEEPVSIPSVSGLHFLTDGYGPTRAFQQVGALLGIQTTPGVSATSSEASPNREQEADFQQKSV